jgi:hypothetical protein
MWPSSSQTTPEPFPSGIWQYEYKNVTTLFDSYHISFLYTRDNIMLINKIDNHILILFECEVTSTTPVTLSWGRNVTSKMLTTEFVFFSKSWTIRSCQLQSIEITYQIKIQIMNWKTYFLNGELNLIINRKIHYQWKYDIFK